MKRILSLLVLTLVVALPSFARYIVVLRDGTRYVTKSKWTVSSGKALLTLENGQTLQLDPALIDEARSEQATRLGLTNANVLNLNPNAGPSPVRKAEPSLGDQVRLRRLTPRQPTAAPAAAPTAAAPVSGGGALPQQVLENFDRAFDNVGIFEKKMTSTSATSLRAEMTVDTEDRVFNAISAAAYLMVRNAGVEGANIQVVELFMKTTAGGAAGRFQMSRSEAEALNNRTMSQQDYFVRKVIY